MTGFSLVPCAFGFMIDSSQTNGSLEAADEDKFFELEEPRLKKKASEMVTENISKPNMTKESIDELQVPAGIYL